MIYLDIILYNLNSSLAYTITKYIESYLFSKESINYHIQSSKNIIFSDIIILELNKHNLNIISQIFVSSPKTMFLFIAKNPDLITYAFYPNVIGLIIEKDLIVQLQSNLDKIISLLFIKKKIYFNSNEGIIALDDDEIIYIEIINRKILLYLSYDKQIQLYESNLNNVFKKLSVNTYFMINRSCIINLKYFKSLKNNLLTITYQNRNTSFIIAKSRISPLKKLLNI